jgi:prevent-host-death family protein
MITSIPQIATVADLQRKYRSLVDKIKKTGEPLVIVNNGQPDVIIMDTITFNSKMERCRQIENEYLDKLYEQALDEHRTGKTTKLKNGQTLIDWLDQHGN